MDTIRATSIPTLLLTVLLGAVLSVLCMNTITHASEHVMHQHATTRISCTQDGATDNGCIPGHSSLIYTLSQTSTTTITLLVFLLLSFSAFFAFLAAKPRTVSKQFYKTRWRFTQAVYAKQVLHWLAMLQKQDSYEIAVIQTRYY